MLFLYTKCSCMAEYACNETDSGRKLVSVHGHCSQGSTATIHRKMHLCSLVLKTTPVLRAIHATLSLDNENQTQDYRQHHKDHR